MVAILVSPPLGEVAKDFDIAQSLVSKVIDDVKNRQLSDFDKEVRLFTTI